MASRTYISHTTAERNTVFDTYRRSGRTSTAARAAGVPYTTARKWLLDAGIISPHHQLTDEEIAAIHSLRAEGLNYREIARRTGRSFCTARRYCLQLDAPLGAKLIER